MGIKSKRLSAAAAAVILALGIAGCNEDNGGGSRGDPESGVISEIGKPADGGVSSDMISGNSDVEEANALAAEAKAFFEAALADANAKGYGFERDTVNVDLIILSVDNGVWSCVSESTTDGAKRTEEQLLTEFAKKYTTLNNSTLVFSVFNGKCTGAFCVDSAFGDIGEGFEIFDLGLRGGEFPASYKWNGGSAGKVVNSKNGKTYMVGTSPVVPMNEVATVKPDDDALSYAYRNAKAMYATVNSFLKTAEKQGFGVKKLPEPHELLIEVSFGRYSVDFDDELIPDPAAMGKFCIRLCDAVKDEHDYSDAWVKAYIVNGECKGVVFMSAGGFDEKYPSYADFEKGSYHWDSADEIGSKDGVTMGVYPELAYAESILVSSEFPQ